MRLRRRLMRRMLLLLRWLHTNFTPHVNSIHSRSEMLRRTLEVKPMRTES